MSFLEILKAFAFGGMDDHHLLQQSIFDNNIFADFRLFEDEKALNAYRDADANKMQLSRNKDVAAATGTPRHAGNHSWIADAQNRLIEDFRVDYKFNGISVENLLEDPNLDLDAFEQAKTYFRDQYLPDIRDQTAKGLLSGDLHLTVQDSSLPAGTTRADLEDITDAYLSDSRFAQSPVATNARAADLADYRSARQSLVDAGGSSTAKFIAFNDPAKTRALVNASDSAKVSPFRKADAESFDKLFAIVDDGEMEAFKADYIRDKKIPPSVVDAVGGRLGGLIGVGALLAAFASDVAFAANADTVEERNSLIQDATFALGAEVLALLTVSRAVPQAIIAVAAYVIYKATTDEEFREVLFDAFDTHVALAPQVVTRFFSGEEVFPSADSIVIQHEPAPGSRYVPIVTGFSPLPPSNEELIEQGIERYEAFVFRLAEASDAFSLQGSNIGFNDSDERFPVSVLSKDGIPIGLVVTQEGLPARLWNPNAQGDVPINSLMPIVATPSDGMFVVTSQDGWGVLQNEQLDWLDSADGWAQLGSQLENLLSVNAQRVRLPSETYEQRTVSFGSSSATYRVYSTWAAEEAVAVRVADNGFDTPTNSNSIINIRREGLDYNIWREKNQYSPGDEASENSAQIDQSLVGGPLEIPDRSKIELFVEVTENGIEIYAFGQRVENPTPEQFAEVKRLFGIYETTMALNPFESDTRTAEVVQETPRDLAGAAAAKANIGPPIIVSSIAEAVGAVHTSDRIVSLSSRLVAARLQQELQAEGKESVSSDDFEERFGAAVRQQARDIYTAGAIGKLFGSVLGNAIAGDGPIESLVVSGTLGAITESVGQAIGASIAADSLSQGFDTALAELPYNLGNAAIGALSSLLTAELISAIGINGVASELLNSAGSAYLGQVLTNLFDGAANPLAGINEIATIGSAVGSFLGAKLAAEVLSFDTIGGQIGASLGSGLGVLGVTTFALAGSGSTATLAGIQLGAAAGPIGAAIGAFVGFIAGGLIGSVFGGTPRSGADVQWDEEAGRFVVANGYSRKGASQEAAEATATVVSDTFNAILRETGGYFSTPSAITAGNYGMYKSDFVYRPNSTREKDAITFRVSTEQHDDAFEQLTRYGVWQGLSDPDFKLIGGDVFVKRALYKTIETSAAGTNFDPNALVGNLQLGRDWSFYRSNAGAVEAIANSLEGDERTAFLAGWVATAARAKDLGLDVRHEADWFGGFNALLSDAETNAGTMTFSFDYDFRNEKFSRLYLVNGFAIYDSVNVASQTMVDASDTSDVIDLRGNRISNWDNYSIDGKTGNSIAEAGVHYTSNLQSSISLVGNSNVSAGSVSASSNPDAIGREFSVGFTDTVAARAVGKDAVVKIVDLNDLPYLLVGDAHVDDSQSHFVFQVSFSRSLIEDVNLKLSIGHGRPGEAEALDQTIEYSVDGGSTWQIGSEISLSAGSDGLLTRVSTTQFGQTESRGLEAAVVLGVKATTGQDRLSNGETLQTGNGHIWYQDPHGPLVWVDDQIIHGGFAQEIELRVSGTTSGASTADLRIYDDIEHAVSISATVTGLDGDDTVHASDLGDNIFGGDGNDTLYGGRLDDWLLGGDGDDTLNAGGQNAGTLGGDGNYLDGGAGNDTLLGREGSDWLEGGDGVDTLNAGDGGDILTGGAGDGDSLIGGAGDDSYLLRIGDGADIVTDSDGSQLTWDSADDVYLEDLSSYLVADIQSRYSDVSLLSGTALSAYVADQYAGNNSSDWFGYYTPGVSRAGRSGSVDGGEDSVVLGQGIGIGDVRLRRSEIGGVQGNDLIVEVMGLDENGAEIATGDSLTLENWFANPFSRVEWLKFADGNEIRIGDLTSFVIGTNSDETLIGTLGNDFVYGGGGDDSLFLLAGDDVGNGGTGSDNVAGDSGDDLIVGGSGDDSVTGAAGNDTLSGDGGADSIYGGANNDLISGGLGDDWLAGGSGDDTFKFNRGDGRDTLVDEIAGQWSTIWTRAGGWASGYSENAGGDLVKSDGTILRENAGTADEPSIRWNGRFEYDSLGETLRYFEPATTGASSIDSGTDTIEFDPTIHIQDIVLENRGDDLVLNVSTDSGESGSFNTSDSLTLSDWNNGAATYIEKLAFFSTGTLDLTSTNLVVGTADDDAALAGGGNVDWITGGLGQDELTGFGGDDILSGNGGADILRGGDGNDVLYGGSGDDVLIGGVGHYSGVYAGDILIGGTGSDWASYEDAGIVTEDNEGDPIPATGLYISFEDITQNSGDARWDSYQSVENIRGSSHDDTIIGDSINNILDGHGGDDRLEGRDGDDTYVWEGTSSGNDVIAEGAGGTNIEIVLSGSGVLASGYQEQDNSWVSYDDGEETEYSGTLLVYDTNGELVYFYELEGEDHTPSQGVDDWPSEGWLPGLTENANGEIVRTVADTSVDAGEDTIELGEGIQLADLSFGWSGDDLTITHSASASILIENQDTIGGKVETLQLHDGLAANLGSLVLNGVSSADDDLIIGATSADNFAGGDGDDVIFGGAGNDTLSGDAGDDVIEGGAGADSLSGGANSLATDNPTGWGDTVRYAGSDTGVTVNLNIVSQSGGDAQGDLLYGFENIEGSWEHADTLTGDDNANRIFGHGGNDLISGNDGDDVIVGGAGSDDLGGGDGEDNITGEEGDDLIRGDSGDDLLFGGLGADRILGGTGDDQILGGEGDDSAQGAIGRYLSGGDGDDLVDGGAGNDDLRGDADNDTLIGGTGDDTLDGGTGDDLFIFGLNDGADSMIDASGIDTIGFTDSITRSQIWLSRSSNDLEIAVIGGDTRVSITGFFDTGVDTIERVIVSDGVLLLNEEAVAGSGQFGQPSFLDLTASQGLTEVPDEMPDAIASELDRYWYAGDTPAPRYDEDALQFDLLNHGANHINVDRWPDNFVSGREDNKLSAEWPTNETGVPADGTPLDGWWATPFQDTQWVATDGPYGQNAVALHAGQLDDTGGTSVAYSPVYNDFDVTKAYEYTVYFRREGTLSLTISMAPTFGGPTENIENDVSGSAHMLQMSANELASLDTGKWYKAVSYILPNGTPDASFDAYGGVYDTETGDKVLNTRSFRWTQTSGTVSNRLTLSHYNGDNTVQGLSTQFFRPEIREVNESYILRDGERLNRYIDSFLAGADPRVEGWRNYTVADGESRWTATDGPDGTRQTVLEAGQFDANSTGGGNSVNDIYVDNSKAYRYTQYFRKSDLTKHGLYTSIIALGASHQGALEKLRTGQTTNTAKILDASATDLQSNLDADKWYKLVAYVLPEGTQLDAGSTLGGIYDAETGQEVPGIDIEPFRWRTGVPVTKATAVFNVQGDELNHGWSTTFGAPEFRAIPISEVAADDADPLGLNAQQRNVSHVLDLGQYVTDADGDLTGYELNPDGAPSQGTIAIIDAAAGIIEYTPFADATGDDSFSVVATDAAGNATIVPVSVSLSAPTVNLPPEVPEDGYSLSFDENSVAGALVGTIDALDPDGADNQVDYMFDDSLMTMVGGQYVTFSSDNQFRIGRDTGHVYVNDGSYDFESGANSFSYDLRLSDRNSGSSLTRASYSVLNITVGDVNEAHTLTNATVEVLHFPTALGPLVPVPDTNGFAISLPDLMLDDPEGQTLTWLIVSASSSNPFALGADGILYQDGQATGNTTYTITVQAVDSNNVSKTADLTIETGATNASNPQVPIYAPSIPGYDLNLEELLRNYNYLPPIILDLDGDGVELLSISSGVQFDIDGDGQRDATGWFAPDDAVLAFDQNSNGLIDDGSEINFQRFVDGAFSDLEGLAFFDTNSNGLFDNADAQWGAFVVWQDANSDGVSDADEMRSLDDLGIVSIDLSGQRTGQLPDGSANVLFATSTFDRSDGSSGQVGDVFFVFDPNTPQDTPVIDSGDGSSGGDDADVTTAPSFEFGSLVYGIKSNNYRLSARGGQLFIRPRGANPAIDQRAGAISGPMIYSFKGHTFGTLSAVVLDLDGDGLEQRRMKKSRVSFDMDGNGARDRTGWAINGDGFLVIDRNANGRIDDATEMAFLDETGTLRNGQAGLLALDTNGDGIVSADDEQFANLQIWVDNNRNGITDIGELQSLSGHGIESISLAFAATEESNKFGRNLTLATTVFTRENGSTGTAGDISFGFVPSENPATAPTSTFASRDTSLEANLARLADLPIQDMSIEDLLRDWPEELGQSERLETYVGSTGGPFPLPVLRVRGDSEADPSAERDREDHESALAAPDADLDATMAARLALLRQDMATFGGQRGLDDFGERRDGAYAPLDYFA